MAGRGRSSLSGPTSPTASSLSGQHQGVGRSLSGPPHSSAGHANQSLSSRLEGARGGCCADDISKGPKHAIISDVSVPTAGNMHHKGLHDVGPRVASPTYSSVSDSYEQEDGELEYGPGIVSKLKNRYMSLAMRESRSRPSLRKFSSLEDLLDSEPTWQEKGISTAKPRPSHDSASRRREVMRRARSVDSLSSRLADETDRGRRIGLPKSISASSRLQSSLNPLAKDDVIIIETPRPPPQEVKTVNGRSVDEMPPPLTRRMSSITQEEEDMPPPDTVRQVKRIFESGNNRPLRGTSAKVAAHKSSQSHKTNGVAPVSKPALKAKPTNVPPRKVTPPAGTSHPVTIEEAKQSLKKVSQTTRASPRGTLSVKAVNGEKNSNNKESDEVDGGERSEESGLGRVRPGLTPVTASVTAPLVNGDLADRHGESVSVGPAEQGVRRISSTAVSNIRKDSQVQEFNFAGGSANVKKESKVQQETAEIAGRSSDQVTAPKQASPTPSPLPSSPVGSRRVLSPSTHTPFVESDRVQQENLKNAEKSRSQPPVSPAVDSKVHTPAKVETPKQTKVESGKPGAKAELFKPTPKVDLKPTPKKVEIKEVRSPVKSDKPLSPTTEELVRSPGRGNLVEAVNTNKQALLGSPNTGKTASSRDRWHQQENTTLVFNFTGTKKETPDYIENDGIDLSRRRPESKQLESGYVIMPGWDGRLDSSTDGEDLDDSGLDYLDGRPGVPPPPSGIVFLGEAVIINGRSNLQRQPKTKKLNISFDDSLTSTYEYPSENSVLEEMGLLPTPNPTLSSPDTPSANQGGLASYTPSKIQIGSTFELGVSRTAPPPHAPPPPPPAQTEGEGNEFLRPADDSEIVTWSAESTSDMLF